MTLFTINTYFTIYDYILFIFLSMYPNLTLRFLKCKENMDINNDIEDIIYEDSFLKNIKRMFIMKQMEQYNIK